MAFWRSGQLMISSSVLKTASWILISTSSLDISPRPLGDAADLVSVGAVVDFPGWWWSLGSRLSVTALLVSERFDNWFVLHLHFLNSLSVDCLVPHLNLRGQGLLVLPGLRVPVGKLAPPRRELWRILSVVFTTTRGRHI